MKKKQLSTHRDQSFKQKTRQTESSEELMHDFIELLTEKVDQMHSMINDLDLNPSSTTSPSDSLVSTQETDSLTKDNPNKEDFLPEDFEPDDIRFQSGGNSGDVVVDGTLETSGRLLGTTASPSSAAVNSGQTAAAILHRTSFDYAPQQTTTYRYGFTNSEFFAFIGSLDPVEYILVVTVIAIIIGVELNVFERQIVGGALVDIGVTLGNMVEQELFQSARQNEARTRQRNEAEQTDFDNLYTDIDILQAEIDAIKQQLGLTET